MQIKPMKIWKVNVESGSDHEDLAVYAASAEGAVSVALDAGYLVSGATVCEIDAYGAKSCVRTLGAPPAPPSQHDGTDAPAPWHAGEDGGAIFDSNARRILDVGRSRAHIAERIVRAVNAFERPSALAEKPTDPGVRAYEQEMWESE